MPAFQQDFIMREIELVGRFYSRVLFGRETEQEQQEVRLDVLSENYLPYRLHRLVDEGDINEAENELFEAIEEHPRKEYLSAAFEFYRHLSELDPVYLKQCGFSEEEILEGLAEVKRIYRITE